MLVYELQAGDEFILEDGARLTVLAVKGDAAVFGMISPSPVSEVSQGLALRRTVWTDSPSNN